MSSIAISIFRSGYRSRILVIGVLFALAIAIFLSTLSRATTFSITATTEALSLNVSSAIVPRWSLHDAIIEDASGKIENFDGDENFDGEVELEPGVSVHIERIATGPLLIEIQGTDPKAAVCALYGGDEKFVREVKGKTVIRVFSSAAGGSQQGQSVVLPMVGQVMFGQQVTLNVPADFALLRSGHVLLRAPTLLRSEAFDAGSTDLNYGDVFRLEGGAQMWGIAVVSADSPAIEVDARGVATHAVVSRFASEGYEVSVSFFDLLKNDPTIQATWACFLFILARLTSLSRPKGSVEQ